MGRGKNEAADVLYGQFRADPRQWAAPEWWENGIPTWWTQSKTFPLAEDHYTQVGFLQGLDLETGWFEDHYGFSGSSSWMVKNRMLPPEWIEKLDVKNDQSSHATARSWPESIIRGLNSNQGTNRPPMWSCVFVPDFLRREVRPSSSGGIPLPKTLSLNTIAQLAAIESLSPEKAEWNVVHSKFPELGLYMFMRQGELLGACKITP